jgi:hypothetical protein
MGTAKSVPKASLFLIAVLVGSNPGNAQVSGQSLTGAMEPAGEGLPLFRPSGGIAALAVATDRWETVPAESRDLYGDYQYIPAGVTARGRGQVFQALRSEEDWPISDDAGLFVAVPWTLGCGCAEVGWNQPTWVTPGDTVAFLLTPTRDPGPSGSMPVYDVLGWHQPYPVGDFIRYWPRAAQEDSEWLSVEEFYHVLQVLPTENAFQLDPEASFQQVLAWVEARAGRSQTFPVRTILTEWRRVTAKER